MKTLNDMIWNEEIENEEETTIETTSVNIGLILEMCCLIKYPPGSDTFSDMCR